MIRNIITLTLNDLAVAFKNKSLFLVLFIPLFVFFTLKLVDSKNDKPTQLKIGLLARENYKPIVIESMKSTQNFLISNVSDEKAGRELLKEKKIDGLLLKSEVLLVLKKESFVTLSMIQSFQALQRTIEGKNPNWITDVVPLQNIDIQKQTMPLWILMLVLLVGFIIMPSQVAEEKEKKLLLSLLQTPMREIEWLLGKLCFSMILIFSAVILLHLMSDAKVGLNFNYMVIIAIGSFCFSSYGILIGFLCRNQASARTLGVIFYLPHLLPTAMADFSKKLSAVAQTLPSYQFIELIKSTLLENGAMINPELKLLYLVVIGILTFYATYRLMKIRWLM